MAVHPFVGGIAGGGGLLRSKLVGGGKTKEKKQLKSQWKKLRPHPARGESRGQRRKT